MKILLAAVAVIITSFSGCVNPYERYYHSNIGDQVPNTLPGYLPCQDGVKIFTTTNFERDLQILYRQGYAPVGYASFTGGVRSMSESNVLEQAANLGACRILVSSQYLGTTSGAFPMTVPNNSTSYTNTSATAYGSGGSANAYGNSVTHTYGSQTVMIPYTEERYEAGAVFLIHRISVLGVKCIPTPSEVTQQLGKNGGVLVQVVVDNGAAYNADILEGDILWTINGSRVNMENMPNLLTLSGQQAKMEIYRKGELLEKTVTLNK